MQLLRKFRFLLMLGCISFLIWYAGYHEIPSKKSPLLLYSTHSRDNLKLLTLQTIKRAKESIYLSTYALTDSTILSLLQKKAKQGIPIHVFYHRSNTPKLHLKEEANLHFHPIKERGLMHEKILIIDRSIILLGTANMTYSSLMMHDNFSIGMYSEDLSAYLIEQYENRLRSIPSPSKHLCKVGVQEIEFYFLPDVEQKAMKGLLQALDGAKKEVSIALFTFTHPLIVEKLIELHQRGVKITLFIDHYVAHGATTKTLQKLIEAGIFSRISRGLQLFHHKWAFIDDHTFILGSANWTQAAFKRNRDFFILIRSLSKKQVNFLNKVINIIQLESDEHK